MLKMSLIKVILKVLRFVRVYNPRAVLRCNLEWRRALASLSDKDLFDRLRFLLGTCSDRVIGRMYDRGVFQCVSESLGVVKEVLENRGTTSIAVVRRLTEVYALQRVAHWDDFDAEDDELLLQAAEAMEFSDDEPMPGTSNAGIGVRISRCGVAKVCDNLSTTGGQLRGSASSSTDNASLLKSLNDSPDGLHLPNIWGPDRSPIDPRETGYRESWSDKKDEGKREEDAVEEDGLEEGADRQSDGRWTMTRGINEGASTSKARPWLLHDGDASIMATTAGTQHGQGRTTRTGLANIQSVQSNTDVRPPDARFVIREERAKYYDRFQLNGRQIILRIITPPDARDPIDWLAEAIKDIHVYAMSCVTHDTDYVGFGFDASSSMHGSIGLSFRPAKDCRHEDLWTLIFQLSQSATEFCIDHEFKVTLNHVSVPIGRGKSHKALTNEDVSKRSLIAVRTDNICLPRALIVSRAHWRKNLPVVDENEPGWDIVRHLTSRVQKQLALWLCEVSNVEIPEDGCGIPEMVKFQTHLATEGLAITVYDFNTYGRGEEPIYDGTRKIIELGGHVAGRLNIMYLPRSRHYKAILNLTAAAANRRFCQPCNIAYRSLSEHRCASKCSGCAGTPACDYTAEKITCTECGRWFWGEACLRKHRLPGSFNSRRTICATLRICRQCDRFVDLSKRTHQCGMIQCQTCHRQRPVNHECYISRLAAANDNAEHLFVFYDFETQQCDTLDEGKRKSNLHVPNLCVVQQACTNCIREPDVRTPCSICGPVREFVFVIDPVKQFVEFATRPVHRFRKIICLAHNARGFDAQFVLRYLVEQNRDPPNVILNGTKIVLMETGHTRFLDSLAYMPMALAALPKAFGLPVETRKGLFPHLFNIPANRGYVGPLPAAEYYSPDSMGAAERTAFYHWYNEAVENKYVFNFDRELVDYCRSDVDILRRACSAFRDIFLTQGGVCPFSQSTTIASACSVLFRRNFLKDNTIGIVPSRGYRMADNQSVKAIEWLFCKERELDKEIIHAGRGREYRIPETGRPVDGYYVAEDGTRHVLEFQGCYWHGCQNCFKANRDKELATKDSMNTRFEKTHAKIIRMRELGYVVTEIWECAFNENLKNDAEMRSYLKQHPLILARDENRLNPRDAFFGGRTNNTKRFYEASEGEKIRYVDVCSLYPWVCKNGRYPVKHPKVYVGRECKILTGPDNTNLDAVEGLVKCVVLPPQDLYHPLLPIHMRGKLMFPLCRTCCENSTPDDCPHVTEADRWLSGTWVADEVKKAVTLGYKIIEIIEIWQYEITAYDPVTKEGGLFAPYIDTFLKLKQEASGWPAECVDETSRQHYIDEYERVEGIRLDKSKIAKNAGLRSVAKLCLNSFWGKFGQRENLPRTEVVKERQRLLELLTDPDVQVYDILPVNERILYVQWGRTGESVIPSPITNVVLAAYTTAQARLKLYSYLEKLQRRVLYFDTDSVIYVESENTNDEYRPSTGNFLGDLTDELASYGPGSYIRSFVSGGPKFYAFVVKRPGDEDEVEVCKVKGVTLNYQTGLKINFQSILDMVIDDRDPILVERRAIQRTNLHHVVTRTISKTCRPVQSKRRLCPNSYDTLPFGYKTP